MVMKEVRALETTLGVFLCLLTVCALLFKLPAFVVWGSGVLFAAGLSLVFKK